MLLKFNFRTIPLMQMQYNDSPNTTTYQLPHFIKSRSQRRKGWGMSRMSNSTGENWCCRRFSPSKIDRCSRSAFPLLFIGFNFFYWSIMTFLSQWNTNQQEFVAFT